MKLNVEMNKKQIQCPYCRTNIDVFFLNNDEETNMLNKNYCSVIKIEHIRYHDYLNIFLTGELDDLDNENQINDILMVYLCCITTILLIYLTFIISVKNDIIKDILIYILIWSIIWFILYSIIIKCHEITCIGIAYISWMTFMIGYILIELLN